MHQPDPDGGEEAMDFEQFEAEERAAGCDEVIERKWKPNQVVDSHTHPFSVRALVVQGEMWLTIGAYRGLCARKERLPRPLAYGTATPKYWQRVVWRGVVEGDEHGHIAESQRGIRQ